MIKRSWIEINLKQIKTNYDIYEKLFSPEKQIMAVVKADAYGHGDIQVSLLLQSIGVKLFAVSNINEAVNLRKAGIKGEILILGYTPVDLANFLAEFNITQTLVSEEYAKSLSEKGVKVKAQFAIDTGMNRIGLNGEDKEYCSKIIHKYSKIFDITGIFTHLCVADTDEKECAEFTKKQISLFENVADSVSDLKLPYIHCLNSAGGINYSCCKYNKIVRLGIILYGLKPDFSNTLNPNIKPCLTWKSVISMVKTVTPGKTIGYGRTFRVDKEMKIATIPTGYADGYNRLLSNIGYVLINGKKARIVGRICMDQLMVDISEIPDAKLGCEVVLLGESNGVKYDADDMAHLINTIGYEIVCNISKRVERIYINE